MGDDQKMGQERRPGGAVARWMWLMAVMLIAAGIGSRVYALGTIAGVNGDEAWYGNAVLTFYRDGPYIPITPNGNLVGPLQFLSLAALQPFVAPSIALLRLPTVVASCAAIWLAFLVGRRLAGTSAGLTAAMIMAALPINIVYARIGWDPSYSGALVLLACWAALSDRTLLAALIAVLAQYVHPTNVFAAPFLLCLFAWDRAGAVGWKAASQSIFKFALLLVALPLLALIQARNSLSSHSTSTLAAALDPGHWAEFAKLIPAMFTGETSFQYVVGAGLGRYAPIAAAGLVVLALLIASLALVAWRKGERPVWPGALVGLAGLLVGLSFLVGKEALMPHYERYGFVLIAPAVMTAALLIAQAVRPALGMAIVCVLGALALMATVIHYFVPLRNGAPNSPAAFWTGRVEPKAAAAAQIRALLNKRPGLTLIAEDFWLAQPVQYLAELPPVRRANAGPDPDKVEKGQIWLVYRNGSANARLQDLPGARLIWESDGNPVNRRIRLWQITSTPTPYSR